MTTQTLLTEWLETYEKEHIKSRTSSRYQGIITAHINPTLGEQHIETLSRRDIQEFLSNQKAEGNIRTGGGKLSATSANLMLTVLNLAFEYACDIEEQRCGKTIVAVSHDPVFASRCSTIIRLD